MSDSLALPPPPQIPVMDQVRYSRKDFASANDVRWCPGCGDYAILAAMQKALPETRVPRENIVFVSGIGCSSRFPYYMATYGFHTIHGRAPTIASGIKISRPDLQVWLVTGDGDGLSIGGNHFMHLLRRNVGVKVLLFNNRIYGLTKGQYSPTSELGKTTKSSPYGTVDAPLDPVSLALGAGATFVARVLDVDQAGMAEVFRRAAEHRGTAVVEIYQNCVVFNDNAFASLSDKEQRPDTTLWVEHGKPLVYGKNKDKGLRLNGLRFEPVSLTDGDTSGLHIHDEKDINLAWLLAQQHGPEPMGVFRDVDKPAYEELVWEQENRILSKFGEGNADRLLNAGDTWTVGPEGRPS